MKYYRNNESAVFAYDDEQLAQVTHLNQLELLIQEKEPVFIDVSKNLKHAELELNDANALLNEAIANQPVIDVNEENESDEEIVPTDNKDEEEIQRLTLLVNDKTVTRDNYLIEFNKIESEYQPLKTEHAAILPVFYDIRDSINSMKKMTVKEVEAHINPPISKEQIVNGAEQKKQTLLAEATEAIAPLQDAIDLDIATEEEAASLKDWKKYRVLLNRVDTSTAPDIEWPEKP